MQGEMAEIVKQAERGPVPDGAALLNALAALLQRYVVMPAHAAEAMGLWVLGAHAFAAWECFPSLGVVSPTKRCGKTRTMTVLGALVPEPLSAVNATAAVIFRAIEKWRPTLLLDEAETLLNQREADPELRGILNAGHTRAGATVLRCAPNTFEPERFSVWCPRAYALIGELPGTLRDRSIVVPLRRRRATDPAVPRMRERMLREAADPLRDLAARWAAAHVSALREADPEVPVALDDRAADGWAALLAVADLAGGEWPGRARAAAVALSGDRVEDEAEADMGVRLLRDLLAVFEAARRDALPSANLCDRLNADLEAPWPTWRGGKGVTPRDLAKMLRPHDIRPRSVRLVDGSTPKGYHAADIRGAAERYADPASASGSPEPASQPPQPPHEGLPRSGPPNSQPSRSATKPSVADDGSHEFATHSLNGSVVADVADRRGEDGPDFDCFACKTRRWWRRGPTGPWVCGVCHPPADSALVAAGVER